VSIDGDADRLVYFYYGRKAKESLSSLHLLDGDKIMALFATFIMEQLSILAGATDGGEKQIPDRSKIVVSGYGPIAVGAGQTAYANGASTKHLKEEIGIEVALTPTGVKHLHEKAAAYDIGLYFEANGHGTILFKESLVKWLKELTEGKRQG
jgi:phosphoacetylglucosamine mutase